MLTEEIINAIRNAPDTVQWSVEPNGPWNDHSTCPCNSLPHAIAYHWRINSKPYERRHTIWLEKTPSPNEASANLGNYLLGASLCWNNYKSVHCNRCFEIIVRELPE